ncbi:ribosomal protein L28e [Capronia epimyces CBS 606.96]|uniref:Ribosomal protein L28e n=1 Tax=Capronia epimyces CBS 606.96 TaxID=1182542 RepID=W9XHC0_9EURO|nr:ribosomal protein L28e [Capronia epimyces CBS 606.96]EXJ79633.1 ribosomal protein L28e [Capronia epimyces CBS 606.96]
MSERSNISGDLLWEVVRHNNAYLVKRNSGGGVQFSRDPFNLVNKHSRKNAGFVNDKAVSVQPNEKGGVTLQTKKPGKASTPASQHNVHAYGKTVSNRKVYKNIANAVGKNSYRSDLNRSAIARASAIKDSQRPKKDAPERKPRGSKASKTEA